MAQCPYASVFTSPNVAIAIGFLCYDLPLSAPPQGGHTCSHIPLHNREPQGSRPLQLDTISSRTPCVPHISVQSASGSYFATAHMTTGYDFVLTKAAVAFSSNEHVFIDLSDLQAYTGAKASLEAALHNGLVCITHANCSLSPLKLPNEPNHSDTHLLDSSSSIVQKPNGVQVCRLPGHLAWFVFLNSGALAKLPNLCPPNIANNEDRSQKATRLSCHF